MGASRWLQNRTAIPVKGKIGFGGDLGADHALKLRRSI